MNESKPSLKPFEVISGCPNRNQAVRFVSRNLQTKTANSVLVSVQTKFESVWNQTFPTLMHEHMRGAECKEQVGWRRTGGGHQYIWCGFQRSNLKHMWEEWSIKQMVQNNGIARAHQDWDTFWRDANLHSGGRSVMFV